MRKNVVFGAGGRLGYPLCLELKRRGEYVRGFIRQTSASRELVERVCDEVVFGDVRDAAQVSAAVEGADAAYHLAAVISIESVTPPSLFDINVGGTANIINACKKHGCRLIFTGSVHAICADNTTDTLYEQERYQPDRVNGDYARSKATACNMVLDAAREGVHAIVALPSGIIGPYEYTMSNIGQMIADVARGKLPFYIEGGYDFVDARDVSSALVDLCDKGESGESYIVTGSRLTVRQLLNIVARETGKRPPRIKVPYSLVRLAAKSMERRSLRRGLKPTFTPYALSVLQENSNFCRDKLVKATGYCPRPPEESLREQVEFYFKELKDK